jgi:hypothetical protein
MQVLRVIPRTKRIKSPPPFLELDGSYAKELIGTDGSDW